MTCLEFARHTLGVGARETEDDAALFLEVLAHQVLVHVINHVVVQPITHLEPTTALRNHTFSLRGTQSKIKNNQA